jgi:hypothetical protein
MHGEGDGRLSVELTELLSNIARDERDGGLHFRYHPRGFFDAIHAGLAEPLMLGHSAYLCDVRLDIRSDQLAITAHPALQIDTVVVVANAPEARLDLGTVLSETLVLTTSPFEGLLGVLQAHGALWGAPWTALFGLISCVLRVGL